MMKPDMKKVAALAVSILGFLGISIPALAQTPTGIVLKVSPPVGFISAELPVIMKNVFIIIFSVATLLVLIFLIIGAFQWITSGGDKEAVGKARSRITAALVGLVILALAFVIIRVIGGILGIPDILQFQFPSLGQP